jgi:hypothetical protein
MMALGLGEQKACSSNRTVVVYCRARRKGQQSNISFRDRQENQKLTVRWRRLLFMGEAADQETGIKSEKGGYEVHKTAAVRPVDYTFG